jgi:hypothetical protein
MSKVWTRSQIEALLESSDAAVERGIVALWKRQTLDEQQASDTKHNNGIGFCSWAARNGSYYASWVNSGRHLTGQHLVKARKIALHHAGQLVEVANSRNPD